ncbi:MAG: ImmA/IrrE family metallo-endopeptidase [Thermomicrobiaceae bacterium]|nr:ImmA/IrrE family metallo-endopeptidase [Thermomicrobiaceae bacterium]
MIGERIKQARTAAGLSTRDLAARVGVSAQAISKYERNQAVPTSEKLMRLADALGVRVEYFLRPVMVGRIEPAFRKRKRLPARHQAALVAKTRDWLERYLTIERIVETEIDRLAFVPPDGFPYRVRDLEEVEAAALALRQVWDLGLDPIENLTQVLEDRGIKVGLIDANDDFDALTFRAGTDGEILVIVVRADLPGDRQRFDLAHEVGHLFLEIDDALDPEAVANRFAGAFLVPRPSAFFELGRRRHDLSVYELHMLKHKYGMSMQAWIYRARDLGILEPAAAERLFRKFRAAGWHKQEPGDQLQPEKPDRRDRLIMQALAEDVISQTRAEELLGQPLPQFFDEVSTQHGDLSAEMRGGYEFLA